jgi:AcrR family transcriptional regulator
VEEIAARAKVSKPIVYEHFGGKEGLYAVLVDREMAYVVARISEAISSGTPRERVERAALAFLLYVRDQREGFLVLSRDAPVALARGGMSSLLNDVAERVSNVFTATFKEAGYDSKAAPLYAHALVGMVTFVGQWWTETRKPSVEVASHLAAGLDGLRHRLRPRRRRRSRAAGHGAPLKKSHHSRDGLKARRTLNSFDGSAVRGQNPDQSLSSCMWNAVARR